MRHAERYDVGFILRPTYSSAVRGMVARTASQWRRPRAMLNTVVDRFVSSPSSGNGTAPGNDLTASWSRGGVRV